LTLSFMPQWEQEKEIMGASGQQSREATVGLCVAKAECSDSTTGGERSKDLLCDGSVLVRNAFTDSGSRTTLAARYLNSPASYFLQNSVGGNFS
jgi:hypothetical protein